MVVTQTIRKSGPPVDLRDKGEAGPVKTTWLPEAFQWYGSEIQYSGEHMHITISTNKISLTSTVSKLLLSGSTEEIYLQIGINTKAKAIAIRKADGPWGMRAAFIKKHIPSISVGCRKLIRKLIENGWPVPCKAPVEWDEEHQMLVARKPESMT